MQREYWNNANHRWNIKSGATRSGKTYLDYYMIAKRLRDAKGHGLLVILGNTKGTIERNILDPMREIWGTEMIGNISSDNTVRLFGKKVYALGADKKTSVTKIQGAGIEYCYGDEITTWSEEIFQMLKSRLDKPTSKFDGTCNPASPNHWFKKFLESNADIYQQHYTIDDNPFLTPFFVEQLKREYFGTVYYNRYILGQWAIAEGSIYPMLKEHHVIDLKDWNAKDSIGNYTHPIRRLNGYVNIGVDFGGNKSAHAFSCTWISMNMNYIVTVKDKRITRELNPTELEKEFVNFVQEVLDEGYRLNNIRADSAEQVLIRGLSKALHDAKIFYKVKNALKTSVNGRIRTYQRLINTDRYFILSNCKETLEAFRNAVWSNKTDGDGKDIRLDDGTTNIDSLDAQEYSTEEEHAKLVRE